MKIYSLITEEINQSRYAMAVVKNDFFLSIYLFDYVQALEAAKRLGGEDSEELYQALEHSYAGFIELRKPTEDTGKCSGAYNIARISRSDNPEHKGAGEFLVRLASSYTKSPLTSDREISTSSAAKKMWARVSQKMQKVPLDSFVYWDDDEKVYVDISSNDGDVQYKRRARPKTPTANDDCVVPYDPEKLGIENAYSDQTVDYKTLIDNFEKVAVYIPRDALLVMLSRIGDENFAIH